MEELAPTQTEEVAISDLCSGAVGALATPEYSLPLNRRNGDMPIGY
jgi:hypothetical protein